MDFFLNKTFYCNTWGINCLGTCICIIESVNGLKGVGLTTGGEPACFIIEKHFARFVEG